MSIMVPRPGHLRPSLALAAIVAIALSACGAPEEAARADATVPDRPAVASPSRPDGAADPTRIVFLGDSITAGYGIAEVDAFPRLVERALRERGHDVDVVNAGVSGDTSAGGRARMDWVLRSEPDVLVVELGANDALRGQPVANTEKNLRRIVRRGRDAGARVLLIGMDIPTSYGPDHAGAFSAMYPRIARDLEVALVPGFLHDVGTDPTLMQPDGLHPTERGHRRLAELLVPHVERLLP